MAAHSPSSPSTAGKLHLRFRPSEQGETRLTAVDALMQTPPLRFVRPFPLPDGAALVHLHNLSGGVLGGDTLQTTIDVDAGARAQVTTTGATRIYRRRAGTRLPAKKPSCAWVKVPCSNTCPIR